MFGQLVLGVLLVQFQHVAVTADLGQDGCCRDGRTVGIALDDGFCRLGKAGRAAVAIDEHMIRPEVQPCYGLRHAVHSSPEDIALVDLLWRDEDDLIGKGAAGDLSEKIVRFFETWDMAVLQMCENELILLPFESFWGTLERDVSLVIPYADIESVKLIDDLLNVVIDIETSTGGVRLTTQQKELSDLRLSGIYATQYAGGYKNWHAENVKPTLQALSELGCKASCE